MINLQNLLDDVKCYETVRRWRWPDGVRCPHCGAAEITKQGRDTTQPARRKYHCERCHRRFDDLTETVLAGRHQPLRVWILCLYFMGLNLSNTQIAQELGLNPDDVQRMTEPLRDGIVARQPEPILVGAVECDEVYVVAGHKGHPDAVKKKPPGSAAPAEGGTRARHPGQRKAADFRDDPTGRGSGDPDAGERPAGHDPAADQAVHRAGNPGIYR